MKKKRFKLLGLLFSLLLVSCYEMQYEDLEEYYDYFDDTAYLRYVDEDGITNNSDTASLEDNFLNKETQDNFNEDCLIDEEYYTYFAVQLDADENTVFRDLALYIRTSSDVLMEINFYLVNVLPDKGRGFNAPLEDKDNEYDDKYTDPIATKTVNFSKNVFNDVYVGKWVIGNNEVKNITIKPDQYLLIQFFNNTGYGKESGFRSVKFTMTNFIFNKS